MLALRDASCWSSYCCAGIVTSSSAWERRVLGLLRWGVSVCNAYCRRGTGEGGFLEGCNGLDWLDWTGWTGLVCLCLVCLLDRGSSGEMLGSYLRQVPGVPGRIVLSCRDASCLIGLLNCECPAMRVRALVCQQGVCIWTGLKCLHVSTFSPGF